MNVLIQPLHKLGFILKLINHLTCQTSDILLLMRMEISTITAKRLFARRVVTTVSTLRDIVSFVPQLDGPKSNSQ
jgi:hypothetical protein